MSNIFKSDRDAELLVSLLLRDKENNPKHINVKDSHCENILDFIEENFQRIEKETGYLPNTLSVDEGMYASILSYQKVRDKLSTCIKELNILKRLGKTYTRFDYMTDNFKWYFPINRDIPRGFNLPSDGEDAGSFAFPRKFDIHTGVDLYCAPGTLVHAVEHGIVTNIEVFTGPRVGSPWWHETKAVWVKGLSGVVVYGEITPSVVIGEKVTPDTIIGNVKKVLKKNKNKPMSMLHLELYSHEMNETVIWKIGKPKPQHLKDPTPYLCRSLSRSENSITFIKEGNHD